MKTICFTIVALLSTGVLFCQTVKSDFEGTWVYQANDTVFAIELKPGIMSFTEFSHTFEIFVGGYTLKVKDVVVENYPLPNPAITDWTAGETVFTDAGRSILAYYDDKNIMPIKFFDQERKHFNGEGISGGVLKLVSPTKLHWTLDEKYGIWWETEGDPDIPEVKPIGFSVPTDVIMTKVKEGKVHFGN